jgi:gamma-glutamyltranspeptidase/glutathione hydrolase
MVQISREIVNKTEVDSADGMVTSMHPLASRAGAEILEQGGNAIDAAVAMGFAIGVVEPYNSGVGAIAELVYYDAASQRTVVVDGTAPLPRTIRPDELDLVETGERSGVYQWPATRDDANNTGYRAVAVPGTPACLLEAHTRFGRLSREQVIAPAIRLAEDGFELDWHVAYTTMLQYDRLMKYPASRAVFLAPGGAPWRGPTHSQPGQRLIQKDLARTLGVIAEQGADGFYRGEIARLIADDMRANGGLLDEQDLADFRVRIWEPALTGEYHGYTIVHAPANNGGPTVLQMLNIVEGFNLGELGWNSAQTLHLEIEAMRRAFADRFLHLGDPDFCPIPYDGVVSKAYAERLRAGIDPRRATPDVGAGDPWAYQESGRQATAVGRGVAEGEGLTTHLCAVDRDRNMVSLTSTLGDYFGSAVVAAGTGVVLNNGAMWFDPRPGSIVSVGPGKRIMTAATPTLVLRDGQPLLAVGAPGGRRVISSVFQILVNILDFGLGPQDAIGAARVHSEGPLVEADSRLPEATIDGLRRRGHDVLVRQQTPALSYFARPNGILVDPRTGRLRGGVSQWAPATAIGL